MKKKWYEIVRVTDEIGEEQALTASFLAARMITVDSNDFDVRLLSDVGKYLPILSNPAVELLQIWCRNELKRRGLPWYMKAGK